MRQHSVWLRAGLLAGVLALLVPLLGPAPDTHAQQSATATPRTSATATPTPRAIATRTPTPVAGTTVTPYSATTQGMAQPGSCDGRPMCQDANPPCTPDVLRGLKTWGSGCTNRFGGTTECLQRPDAPICIGTRPIDGTTYEACEFKLVFPVGNGSPNTIQTGCWYGSK